MSESPSRPLSPLEYQSLPHGKRPWSLGEIICWAIVVVIVGLIVWGSVANVRAKPPVAGAGPSDSEVAVSGRALVGLHEIKKLAKQEDTQAVDELRKLDAIAKHTDDYLRIAILKGEIEGRQTGLRRLDELLHLHPEMSGDIELVRGIYETGEPTADSARWETFHKRFGWYADLAVASTKPEGDAFREETLGAAKAGIFATIGAALVVLLGGIAGLVLLIVAGIRTLRGRQLSQFDLMPGMPGDRRTYLEGFTVYLSAMLVAGIGWELLFYFEVIRAFPGSNLVPMLLAFVLGLIWPLLRGQSFDAWRMATGMHAGRGIFREVGAGILGYVAGLPVIILALTLSLFLTQQVGANPTHPITRDLTGPSMGLLGALLLASVWAPITEELMFRGHLFAHLRQRFGWLVSSLVLGVVFAAIHPQGWTLIPGLAAVSMVLSGIREWRGSIIGGMTAHAVHNGALVIVLYTMFRDL